MDDGWSVRKPLINFMAVTESGHMFFKAVNCEKDDKYRFIWDRLSKSLRRLETKRWCKLSQIIH